MKPNPIIILSAVVALMAFSAGKPIQGKIKTFASSQNGDTMTRYYDAEGRLSYYTGHRGYKTSYEYKGNAIIQTTLSGSTVTMYLNGRGLVDSLTDIDPNRIFENGAQKPGVRPMRAFPYAGNHVLSYLDGGVASRNTGVISKKFSYDSEGFLREEKEYVNGQLWATSVNIVEAGNITSYTIKYFFNDTVSVINPKTMISDTRVIQLGNRFFTISYDATKQSSLAMDGPFGKCSRNLAMRMVDHSLPVSGDSTVFTYQYTFDNSHRVSSLFKTAKSTGPPEWNDDEQLGDKASYTYY